MTLNHMDYLSSLSMAQLTSLAKHTKMSGYSKLKKADMVDKLHLWMSSQEVVDSALADLSTHGINQLKNILEEGKIPFDASHITLFSTLFAPCYLSAEEEKGSEQLHTVLIPEFKNQISHWIENLTPEYCKNRLVLDCANACVKLWGVAPQEEFLHMLHKTGQLPLTWADCTEILSQWEEDSRCYVLGSDHLMLKILDKLQCGDAIASIQKGKPYYYPPQDLFAAYFDGEDIWLNPVATVYSNFLTETLQATQQDVVALLEQIMLAVQIQGELPTLPEILEQLHVVTTDAAIQQQHLALLHSYRDQIRLWMNNGFTATENASVNLATRATPPTEQPYIRRIIKIGRNDPCPCGSQKKYKKCCGR